MEDVDGLVLILIKLAGISKKKSCLELSVSPVVSEAVSQVKNYLTESGFTGSYLFYWNNKFVSGKVSINWQGKVKKGDIFQVVPLVSGG